MTPFVFEGCLGWLHQGTNARGVVMCSAQGFEALCSYRAWYLLAERIAAAGCPVLRFDYPGAGDSAGGDAEAGAQAWLASIDAAIERLKAETGVTEIVLVGLRIGATLAAMVAEKRGDISGLVLLAPVLSGKAYMRELKVQGRLLADAVAPPGGFAVGRSGIDVAGFRVGDDSAASFAALDLLAIAGRPAPRVLILPQPAAAADTRLADRLAVLGAIIETGVLSGYEDLMADPTLSREPPAWSGVTAWVTRDLPAMQSRPIAPSKAAIEGPDWTEIVLQFGPSEGLAGILCKPHRPGVEAPLAVFVNGGRNARMGWARSTTLMARRLANAGIASFRLDAAGLGDSHADPQRVGEILYADSMRADVSAALDRLQKANETFSNNGFVIVGLCAGAHLAFHSAVADPRIVGIALINLQRFIWRPTDSLDVVMRQTPHPSSFYRARLFRRETWSRLARGDIHIASIAIGLVRRKLGPMKRRLDLVSARAGLPTALGRVHAWLRRLKDRNVWIVFVHAADDPAMDEFAFYFGPGNGWMARWSNIGRLVIPSVDHNLTPEGAQDLLHDRLVDMLTALGESRRDSQAAIPVSTGALPRQPEMQI